MRSIPKILLGGALTLLLAISVTPANAVVPPQGEPTPPAVSEEGPGGQSDVPAAPEYPSVAPDDSDHPELNIEQPANPEELVQPEDEAETRDPAIADESDEAEIAEESDPELLIEPPGTLPVTGLVVVVPGEVASGHGPLAGSDTDGQAAEAVVDSGEPVSDRVMIATDEGPVVEIDPALVGTEPETGERFEGSVALDESARATVDKEIAEAGAIAVGNALEAVGLAAAKAETLIPVTGAVVGDIAVGAAPAQKNHKVDMIFFTGGANPSDSDLRALVSSVSSYWKGQTNGAISGLSVNYKARKAPVGNSKTLRCSPRYTDNLWSQGAKAFGRSAQSYLTSGRHLLVVVDDNCGAASEGVAGWGTYGKGLHSGGMVWADIGQRGGGAVSKANGIIAHEIGHNLSLGHGNTRVCSGSTTDAKQSSAGTPASPCWDIEYGDIFNVMGYGASVGGAKPAALPISQKSMLGVAPSGSIKTVKASGGRSQTFTLQPGGSASGLRGLKVESPTGGSFFVEYRNVSGQDSGLGLNANNWLYLDSRGQRTFIRNQGVRVMKTHTKTYSSLQNIRTSTVVPVRDTVAGRAGLAQMVRPGKSSTPWNSTARVVVVSTGSTAKVRIDYSPFVDVPYAHKYAKEIGWMNSSGLSTGAKVSGGVRKYAPKSNVTREVMAAFLYRLEAPKGYKPLKKSPFQDISTKHPFYKAISWMYTSGLSKGTKVAGGRKYSPKSSVTREVMAAFLYRLEGAKTSGPSTSPFSDVKKGHRYYKEISWMYSTGLSTGVKSNGKRKYSPGSKVSREVMAAFIYRLEH